MNTREMDLWAAVYVAIIGKPGCSTDTAEFAANEAVRQFREAERALARGEG